MIFSLSYRLDTFWRFRTNVVLEYEKSSRKTAKRIRFDVIFAMKIRFFVSAPRRPYAHASYRGHRGSFEYYFKATKSLLFVVLPDDKYNEFNFDTTDDTDVVVRVVRDEFSFVFFFFFFGSFFVFSRTGRRPVAVRAARNVWGEFRVRNSPFELVTRLFLSRKISIQFFTVGTWSSFQETEKKKEKNPDV